MIGVSKPPTVRPVGSQAEESDEGSIAFGREIGPRDRAQQEALAAEDGGSRRGPDDGPISPDRRDRAIGKEARREPANGRGQSFGITVTGLFFVDVGDGKGPGPGCRDGPRPDRGDRLVVGRRQSQPIALLRTARLDPARRGKQGRPEDQCSEDRYRHEGSPLTRTRVRLDSCNDTPKIAGRQVKIPAITSDQTRANDQGVGRISDLDPTDRPGRGRLTSGTAVTCNSAPTGPMTSTATAPRPEPSIKA
jgi:hypothetical protein